MGIFKMLSTFGELEVTGRKEEQNRFGFGYGRSNRERVEREGGGHRG